MAISISSCVSTKKVHYFQDFNSTDTTGVASKNFETRIKPDDALIIIVSALDPAAAEPFNLPLVTTMGTEVGDMDRANGMNRFQTYLVDRNGEIEFPVLGKIAVGGLTKEEVLVKFDELLSKYIQDPIVNVRIANFKVSIMGEVARPGSYEIASERISLPEALSKAGDLTIYGNRQEVLLIRDNNGNKTHYMVDLTSAEVINSPLFYMQQNDIVYVKPNKVKTNSAGVGPNTSVIISALSLLLTTIALITR